MKNVMLLCMSPLKWWSDENEYSYRFRNGAIGNVHGRMTNEAPVKSLIEKLKRDYNQRLDRIVMICSEKVTKETIEKDESQKNEPLIDGKHIWDLTHKDYFEGIIKKSGPQTALPCIVKAVEKR